MFIGLVGSIIVNLGVTGAVILFVFALVSGLYEVGRKRIQS